MKETHRKLIVLVSVIILAPILGAAYGIALDQFTFTLSPEFFTKNLFYKLGLFDDGVTPTGDLRHAVTMAGIMSTWWVALISGAVLGAVGMLHATWQRMLSITLQAMFLNLFVAAIIGFAGFMYAFISFPNLSAEAMAAAMPENVTDVSNYYLVSTMHTFSYWGGGVGLLAAAIWSWRQSRG